MYRIFNYIYSINYLGRQLLREVLNYSDEYLFEELTPRTLKKMHNFLVEHKCAETFKEIKSKNQINIKGCAPNGLERLIPFLLPSSSNNLQNYAQICHNLHF